MVVEAFFAGLLPDEERRLELAQRTLSEATKLQAELEHEGITSSVFAQIGSIIAQRSEFLRR